MTPRLHESPVAGLVLAKGREIRALRDDLKRE
jgi:hypothetical protein